MSSTHTDRRRGSGAPAARELAPIRPQDFADQLAAAGFTGLRFIPAAGFTGIE